MNSPTLLPQPRSTAALSLAPNGKPDPSILSLPEQARLCRSSAQETGRLTLRTAIPSEVRQEMTRRVEAIQSSLSVHADKRTAIMVASRLRSMPRRSDDDLSADILFDVWTVTLQDPEMTGVIPGWAMEEACRAYLAGRHGKWMPSPGEFVETCKALLVPVNRAWIEMRQHLDAPVETERSAADRERMQSRVSEILARFRPPAPVAGE